MGWLYSMMRAAVWALAVFGVLLGLQDIYLAGADSDGHLFQGRIAEGSAILSLQHKYAGMDGSSFQSGGRHMTRDHFELLKKHDRSRARRFLTRVATFDLGGNPDPDAQALYYTQLKLGTPPQTFNVQVDTGSDLMWVYCSPCKSCPSGSSGLGFEIKQFDPKSSSSSESVGCGEAVCSELVGSSNEGCAGGALCEYTLVYGDQSSTTGYVVSDLLTYRELHGDSTAGNATARIVFGCGFDQSGDLSKSDRAVDGILGFGQSPISVPSQLYTLGKTPNVFAHCLEGEGKGGGIMVLGAVEEPQLTTYTPLIENQPHYNVELHGIAVAGVNVSIDSSAFASSKNGQTGVIFDSGTTLTLLSAGAFSPTFRAVSNNIKSGVRGRTIEGLQCFMLPSGSKPEEYFPSMTLYFKDAQMQLTPRNYLFELEQRDVWCLGWQESSPDLPLTIIGDIVLKDRIVEYDNVQHRIGWLDYDCSSSLTVSASEGNDTVSASPLASGVRSSAQTLAMAIIISLGWFLVQRV